MPVLYYWKYKCQTENTWVYEWAETKPTQCKNDAGHTISATPAGAPKAVKTQKPDEVTVKEQDIETAGKYRTVAPKISIPTGAGPHEIDYFTYDIPINILSTTFVSTTDHEDDVISVSAGPGTTIGAITSDVAISDTEINVDSTVMANIYLGDYVTLDDGTNQNDLGMVIQKNSSSIVVKTAATNTFATATPTYVKKTTYFVENFTIGPPWTYSAGEDKIGASYVPANTPIKIYYTNNSGLAKDLKIQLNFLHG